MLLNFYSGNHEKLSHSISLDDLPLEKLQEDSIHKQNSTFSEIADSLSGLQSHINSIALSTEELGADLNSNVNDNALKSFNKALPAVGNQVSHFSKSQMKLSQPLTTTLPGYSASHKVLKRFLSDSNHTKNGEEGKRRGNDENTDSVGYGTFGKYPKFRKDQMAMHRGQSLHDH